MPGQSDLPFGDSAENDKFRILGIACGREHSVVLTNRGVASFGSNCYGQCGRPIVEDELYFGNRAVVQDVSGHMEMEDADDTVVSVVAGQDHTCFLTRKGRVLTCGWSSDGQTGQDVFTTSAIPRVVGGDLKGVRVKKVRYV